ncbi:MAG: glucosaminidase domain-containing protein [Alphaproteobacteria bacterium]|jgi:Bax protein|nr:glucosaminidase domain-containing protein [Alphaproteobacteria bacterium]
MRKPLIITIITSTLLSACHSVKVHSNKHHSKDNITISKEVTKPIDNENKIDSIAKKDIKPVKKSEETIKSEIEVKKASFPNGIEVKSIKDLQKLFNSSDYDIDAKTSNLIISNISKDLFKTKDIKLKKDIFFKTIYPIAYQINKEIEQERYNLDHNKNLVQLMMKYKVKNIEDLRLRLNTIPIPMLLAQAAIESAYGTSRFAEEGNALFGQWTRDKNGMTPKGKPNSLWKVARFDTPLDSARAYAFNMNTNRSYAKFRELRNQGKDPIFGLAKYSQKGEEYINIVNSVIKVNNLNKYKF